MKATVRYFSATGTTKKIARAFAGGLGGDVRFIDFTRPSMRESVEPAASDLEVWAVPIHGERIPGFIRAYLKNIRGHGTPLVVFSIYGNVGVGISMTQFTRLAADDDFRLIGAGTFIGQHTFANADTPVGLGRPDGNDLAQAHMFGEQVRKKLEAGSPEVIRLPGSAIPTFIEGFPERGTRFMMRQPAVNLKACKHCGFCINNCPVNAIDGVSYQINETKCIRCLACVQGCPAGARKAEFRSRIFARVFGYMGEKRNENQIYI